MNLTYEDLYAYQGMLKTLLKAIEPNLYVCFITESLVNHIFFIDDNKQIIKLGYIVLGIRKAPGNFNTIQVAYIYNNGFVENTGMNSEMFYTTLNWLYLIETQLQRHRRRLLTIKDELLAVVYHPENVRLTSSNYVCTN